jgi:hypothetical protein
MGGVFAAVALAAPIVSSDAIAFQTGQSSGTHQTIDCQQSPKCMECGRSSEDHIICCFADSCTIINYPPQYVEPVEPVRPPVRYRPLGLGTGTYFAR